MNELMVPFLSPAKVQVAAPQQQPRLILDTF